MAFVKPRLILRRGTRAAQPGAASVAEGTLYCVTDEGGLIERSDGAVWAAFSPSLQPPVCIPPGSTPTTGALLYIEDDADPATPNGGEASVHILRTLADPAHDTTAIGFQASIQNNGADIATTAHHIGGFGVAQDTAAGRQALYGLEGKVEGRGTAHTGIYAGAVLMANFVGAACAALNYGVRVLAKVTTDGSVALAQGTNVGVYIDTLVGGASKWAVWAYDLARFDTGVRTPDVRPVAASGTDQAGTGLVFGAGLGTGSAADSGVLLQIAKPTATGSAEQAASVGEFWQYAGVSPEQKIAVLFSDNGAQWRRTELTEELTLSTVDSHTDSVANLLPSNAIIEAVAVRVTEAITGAGGVWNVGDPLTSARFVDTHADVAAGTTKVGLRQWDPAVAISTATGPTQATDAKVRIWQGAAATTGRVRVTVFCRQFVAPTS